MDTYDYIIALREQDEHQEDAEHQSPHMSIVSSVTGFSATSSFGALHPGSWCTPARLFLDDQDRYMLLLCQQPYICRKLNAKDSESTQTSQHVRLI